MDPYIDDLDGFSMAKVVLSNALPRAVYDPIKEEDERGRHQQPDPAQTPPPTA